MACCVYGGLQYNYKSNVTFGQTGFNVCFDYTEAANAIVASKVLLTEVCWAVFLFPFSIPLIVFDLKKSLNQFSPTSVQKFLPLQRLLRWTCNLYWSYTRQMCDTYILRRCSNKLLGPKT